MKKFLSLLKANTKRDLNVFKFKNNGKFNWLLIIVLSLIVMSAAYIYADLMMMPLHDAGLTYVGLTLFSLVIVFITMMEGVYKSQGIIFDAKDNNLLFSMPIKKNYILIVRFIKVLLFDYIFEILFLLPCFFKYILLENPTISFYLLTILFIIILPLIPLIIAFVIGYIIKTISVFFKNKKMIQTLLSLLFFFLVFILSMNLEKLFADIVKNATSINDIISKMYLPIGLYIDLIENFDITKLILLILISIVPFFIFIIIFSKNYDKIINNSKESTSKLKSENKISKIKYNSIIKTLTIKEIKNYFSIPIYIINTIISPILALVFSVGLVLKKDSLIQLLNSSGLSLTNSQINSLIPYLFIVVILLLLSISSITASSISLEGKRYTFLKSLPIKEKDIFLSKLLLNDIIIIPSFVISAIIYIINFKIFNYNILLILFTCLALPHVNGQIGLIVNLKYPRLDYNSEIEVVKQSIAVLITMAINFIMCCLIIYSAYKLLSIVDEIIVVILFVLFIITILIVLNKILINYGTKRYREIN